MPPLTAAAGATGCGSCLPAGPSGPAPLDAERLLLTAKGANNVESSAAKARLRILQKSKIFTSSAPGRTNPASSNARRADVARAEGSPEQAQYERQQLLKSRALVRLENLKKRNPSPPPPESICAGPAPLPGARTRRSPNAKSRDLRPYLISRAHVRFANPRRQRPLISTPPAASAGLELRPRRLAKSQPLGQISNSKVLRLSRFPKFFYR